jgi:hypothetical protein
VYRLSVQHPTLYRQLLSVLAICFLVSGIYSMVPLSLPSMVHRNAKVDLATVSAETPVEPERPVRPEGWGGVNKLPGSDGTASALRPGESQPAPVAVVATSHPTIPLGAGGDVQTLGRSLNAVTFGDQHWTALQALWTRESGWNPQARNRFSGACGIPQALPCSKIPDMSPQGQIEWGLQYIKQRYGNPTNAWNFWQSHHWY